MNLTDLTDELEFRAAAVRPAAAASRIAGVRARLRSRRRRQAGAAVAVLAVAGCAAAFTLLPPTSRSHAEQPAAPAVSVPPLPVDPLRFAPALTGDPLLTARVGELGNPELVLRFMPEDTNLMLTGFCRVAVTPAGQKPLWVRPTVNGHPIGGYSCTPGAGPGEGSELLDQDPRRNRADWAELGVRPGRLSVVRFRLQSQDGTPRTSASVQLGLAVYVLSGDRVRSGGIEIKVDAENDQHAYRLVGYRTAAITRTHRELVLQVPADREPSLVMLGTPGVALPADASPDGLEQLRIGGESRGVDNFTLGDTAMLPLEDADAHTLTLKVDPKAGNTGTMLLAFYQRVD